MTLRRHLDRRPARGRTSIIALIVGAFLVTACTPASSTAPAGSAGATTGSGPTTAPPDTAVLTVATDNLGSQIYAPHLSGQENRLIVMMIGDTLTQLNKQTAAIDPALAESWTPSADLKTWTFKLRAGVPFQDGYGTVTAADVSFSWEQWLDPETAQGAIGDLVLQAIDGNIANFEIVSDLEFKLHTENPVANLPAVLTDFAQSITIQSKKYFDEDKDKANVHPLGTGPYKFVSNAPGVEVVLEAVDSHPFRDAPTFKKLVIKEIADQAARLAQVQAGSLDLALGDSGLVGEAEAAGVRIQKIDDVENCSITLGGYYLGTPALDVDSPWIQANEPAKGKAIRDAMSLAIDRATILDRIVHGYGSLTYGPLMNFPRIGLLNDPSWTPPPYDVALAKQKLAEGGYPDGFPITLRLWEQVASGEAVADMWKEIGIDVTVELTEQALMRPLFQASNKPDGNSATDGLAWIFCQGAYPTPELNLVNAFMKTGRNMQMFNPAIDVAEEAMRTEPDEAARYTIARQLVTTLRNDGAPINLYTADYPWFLGPRIGSWDPYPRLNALAAMETVTAAP